VTIDDSVVLPDDASRLRAKLPRSRPACVTIEGHLFIDRGFAGSTLLDQPESIIVTGDVRVRDTELTDLSALRVFTEVGASLVIEDNAQLESVDGLDALTLVGDDFHVEANHALEQLQGPELLARVGGDIRIEKNSMLRAIAGFDRLTHLADYDNRWDRPRPGGVSDQPPQSRSSGEPIDPHLIVAENAELEQIEGFRRLTDIDGDIRLTDNPKLSDITGFESLEFMTGRLEVRDSPQLVDISALVRPSCLASVVLENTGLADLSDFGEVYELGAVELRNNPKLRSIGGLRDQLAVRGPVQIADNPALVDLDEFWGLPSIGQGGVNGHDISEYRDTVNARCSPTEFEQTYGHVTLEGNDALQSIGEAPIGFIAGDLVVRANDSLSTIDGFSELGAIGGEFRVEANPKLAAINGFEQLSGIEGGIFVEQNPRLTAIDGFGSADSLGVSDSFDSRNVEQIDLRVAFNPKLSRIDAFGQVDGKLSGIELVENPALNRFVGLSGVYALDWLTIEGNGLSSLDFTGSIDRIEGDLNVSSNSDLAIMDGFGALTNVEGSLRIEANAALTGLRGLANLEEVRNGLYVRDNPSLPGCEATWLEQSVEAASYVVVDNNATSCD
jgi:hypothetical protein